jgi:glycosyltransferase involved in cell wall biosynthesis
MCGINIILKQKDKFMKIAQIVCTYPPYKGGIGNVAKKFTELLKTKGHKVFVFTPLYNKKQKDKFDSDVIPLLPILKYGNGALIMGLLFRLRKMDHVILHYPFFGASELVWLCSLLKFKKIKFSIFYHMDVVNNSLIYKILSLPSKIISKSLFRRARVCMCSSFDYIENSEISEIYSVNKNKFIEIPFGIDIVKFRPVNFTEEKYSRTILFVGGLDKAHYFKGLNNLIRAFSKLDNDKFELVVIGDGDMKSSYEQLAVELGCSGRIRFAGSVSDEDLVKEYQRAYFFVLPSINKCEAFGLVLLEAMACGLPVIASDLPGVRTVFDDTEQGFLVEKDNVGDLLLKMNVLINNTDLRDKMSISSRKLTEEKYSWDVISDKLEKTII